MSRKYRQIDWFNKLTFDPTDRIRMNFSWLYTPPIWKARCRPTTASSPIQHHPLRDGEGELQQRIQPAGTELHGPDRLHALQHGAAERERRALLPQLQGNRHRRLLLVLVHHAVDRRRRSSRGLATARRVPRRPARRRPFSTRPREPTSRRTSASSSPDWANTTIKAGVGTQKNVNSVFDSWYGPDGRVRVYWDSDFRG